MVSYICLNREGGVRDDLQELVDRVSRVLGAPATLEAADFTLLAFCAHPMGGDGGSAAVLDAVRTRSILTRGSPPETRRTEAVTYPDRRSESARRSSRHKVYAAAVRCHRSRLWLRYGRDPICATDPDTGERTTLAVEHGE